MTRLWRLLTLPLWLWYHERRVRRLEAAVDAAYAAATRPELPSVPGFARTLAALGLNATGLQQESLDSRYARHLATLAAQQQAPPDSRLLAQLVRV